MLNNQILGRREFYHTAGSNQIHLCHNVFFEFSLTSSHAGRQIISSMPGTIEQLRKHT